MMSLRKRLTLWYGAGLVLCLCLALFPAYDELILDPRETTNIKPKHGWHSFHAILRDMLIEVVPLVSIGIAGGWFITNRALRPLDKVIEAASLLDEHNLGARIPDENYDKEISRLIEVYNTMSVRLENSFLRVKDFMLHASHELKTPLAILRGNMETSLVSWKGLSPDQINVIAAQVDEIDRLTRIVDGMFLLSKADAEIYELSREPTHMLRLVEEMAEAIEILSESSGIQIELRSMEDGVIFGDRNRLRQMLLNLADNAVKHNHTGGWIKIELLCSIKDAFLVLSNSRTTVAPEEQERVFERFYRGRDNAGNVPGCGLGLSIAKWVAEAHDGSISYRSMDGYTEIELRLPLATQA